jgi:hypothetical protein
MISNRSFLKFSQQSSLRALQRIAKEQHPQGNKHVAYERLNFALCERKKEVFGYTEGGAREGEEMTNEGVTVGGSSSSIPRKNKIGAVTTTRSAL